MPKDLADCLKLQVESEALEGYLLIRPGYDPAIVSFELLMNQLEATGLVKEWIDTAEVHRLVSLCQSDATIPHKALVCKGIAAKHGENGQFQAEPQISRQLEEIEHRKAKLRALEEEDAIHKLDHIQAIDFRSQSGFVFVSAGQRLGTLTDPTDGCDGQDIFGNTIKAERGAPAPIEIGEGVRLGEDGAVVAAVDGVLWQSTLRISVDESLHIEGPVDYSTGNINFTGDISVEKEVQDCFKVSSAGSMVIRGLVQAAQVRAEHELNLMGGMAGREKGQVFAGRGLRAKYLDAARGVIRGTCHVDNEINACELTVLGSVEAPSATLRGGWCAATMGISIGTLGGPGGIVTEVIIGHLPEQEDVVRRTGLVIPALEAAAAEAEAGVEQFKRNLKTPTKPQAAELAQLEKRASERRTALTELRGKAQKLCDMFLESTRATITIHWQAFPGARIWLAGYRIEFRTILKGPISFTVNKSGELSLVNADTGEELAPPAGVKIERDNRILPLTEICMFASAA